MSRVGKKPIEIPSGVTITVDGNNNVTVKGPKGELSRSFSPEITINVEENVINVTRPSESKTHRTLHGTTRALLANMVEGVSKGFEKSLELVGVGYRAQKQGKKLVLNVGSSTDLLRNFATSSARFNCLIPSIVARIILIGVLEPRDLDVISATPANSSTARTGPPAITPVPGEPGFIRMEPAPKRPITSCGIVVPTIGTSTKFFLASSTALRIASGTSCALPVPKPTWPFLSPTTTSAEKRKRRPPLTTFATRLTVTTRSYNSSL